MCYILIAALQVLDCGRFWAQNADAENLELLNSIHTRLQQYIREARVTVRVSFVPLTTCASSIIRRFDCLKV